MEQSKAEESQQDSQVDTVTPRTRQRDPAVLWEQDAAQTHHAACTCSLVLRPTQHQFLYFCFSILPLPLRLQANTARICSCHGTLPYHHLLQYKHSNTATGHFWTGSITNNAA